MTWTQIARLALALVLQEVRARRAADRHARGPTAVLVTCTTCGQRVRADSASMAAHRSACRDQRQDRH